MTALNKMTIYLSGPMTGYPEFNYPRFNAVAAMLRDKGHVVYNPAEFPHHGDFPIRQAFAEYTAFICNRADTIVLLEGWEQSKGALAEYHLALNCKLRMLPVDVFVEVPKPQGAEHFRFGSELAWPTDN